MMKTFAVAALFGSFALMQPAYAQHSHSHHMESTPEASSAPYDLQFIDTMISHHEGALQMAQFVEGRSNHPVLLRITKDINNTQQAEIADMYNIRDEHFTDAKQAINMDFAGMRDSMKGMNNHLLEKLQGAEFDKEFARQMIPHHQGALVMCSDAKTKTKLNAIKELCEKRIVPAQTKEIAEMEAILKE